MTHRRAWTDYHPAYRAEQMRELASWIAAGQSGSVVGMGGAGKSNLLGFLVHRPEVLSGYLPEGARAMAVLVDLNSLPALDLATLYRLLLRGFRSAAAGLEPELAAEIERVFAAQLAERDPFVVQTALLAWLARLTDDGRRVGLVFDRFDRFAERATPEISDSLRALRDAFKGRLGFIVGMRQPCAYLPDPGVLGELQELLDTHTCWVGPMVPSDARRMLDEELLGADPAPTPSEAAALLDATGGYPALLKSACAWWRQEANRPPRDAWPQLLGQLPAMRVRLDEVWEGLTQAEQAALTAVATGTGSPVARRAAELEHGPAFELLEAKGLLVDEPDSGWRVQGRLLALRAGGQTRRRGRLWLDDVTGEVHLGATPLRELTRLERGALLYLLARSRVRVGKTELIEGVWPDDVVEDGIMDDALYQVVRGLRRKIEPDPGRPRYLVTWRGRPEGGYQLFPEGRPS
ncbi:MAG: winged helix-turn-helix domain-containing protein [Chloroflexi bacterium]|nr:winged helix-turn-helix domain-containing protein [Chloroflexota bacterium]